MRATFRVARCVALLLASTIGLAPATWVDRPLAARTQDRLRLIETSGYWWNGRGSIATADGASRIPVAWRVNFAALLQGARSLDFKSGGDDALPSGTLSTRGDDVQLHELRLRLPATLVAALLPPLRTIAAGGDISVRAPAFAWRAGGGDGTLDAEWRRARLVAGDVVVDLGTVALTATPSGGQLSGTIRNEGGDVAIDGTLTGAGGLIEAAVTLKPTSAASDAVRQAVSLLGPPDGSGGVKVTWQSGR